MATEQTFVIVGASLTGAKAAQTLRADPGSSTGANALHGGPAAARSMLGQQVSYDRVPYFSTDQYDVGMEFSGG